MSYGESVPPLELSGVRLACLSGDNGNGKTALLDAMTWALFDECRAKSKDDVIRLGTTDCAVFFDFLVDEQRYRVRRQISKKSSGSLWDLQIRRDDGSFHPLSGTNQKETRDKIKTLLRMDYETFVATSYLAQGRADEFARATPNKRKEVLADILDLSRYDRLEELAKERGKELAQRETDLVRELNAIEATLADRDRFEMQLEDAQRKRAAATAERDVLTVDREQQAINLKHLDLKEQRARDLEEKIADAEARNAEDQATVDALAPRIAQAQVLVARQPEIEQNALRFERLQADIGVYEESYRRALELGRECARLEATISAEQIRIDRERYQKDHQAQEFERDVQTRSEVQTHIAELEMRRGSFGDVDSLLSDNDTARQATDNRIAELKGELGALRHADTLLVKRLDALTSSDLPNCEYCGQPLPPERREQSVAEADQERARLYDLSSEVTAKGSTAKRESDRLRLEAESLQRTRREISECDAQIKMARQQEMRLEERVRLLPQIIADRDALALRLAHRDYSLAEQEQLAKLSGEREKAEAAYAPMETARAELNFLKNALRERDFLHDAVTLLATEPERVAALTARIADRVARVVAAQKIIAGLRNESSELPTLRRQIAEVDAQIAGANERIQKADQDIGQWTTMLDRCRTAADNKVTRTAELVEAQRSKEIFRELTAAFGKKGVQALIIENALPEIVVHANELLTKLSQGAMQVELRTTREARTKTAGNIETLDIIISDDMGTRPYEMYSGGEAFRVNFALRVALSRMLANRAGAPLQTLIVDEGFGTQDPRGREAITDALQSIQEYFAMILCITHIEEIKEAFPTRIEVVKGANGSTFSVA